MINRQKKTINEDVMLHIAFAHYTQIQIIKFTLYSLRYRQMKIEYAKNANFTMRFSCVDYAQGK